MLAPQAIDVDAAVKNALANRTDIQQFKKKHGEHRHRSVKFAENQRLPGGGPSGAIRRDRRRRHAVHLRQSTSDGGPPR